MHAIAITLSIITAVAFLTSGAPKLAGNRATVGNLARLRITDKAASQIAVLEIVGAAALLLGVAVADWLALLAAVGLTVMMIAAVQLHRRQNNPPTVVGPAALCLGLALLTALTLLFA